MPVVICKSCGAIINSAYTSRMYCDECKHKRNRDYMRQYQKHSKTAHSKELTARKKYLSFKVQALRDVGVTPLSNEILDAFKDVERYTDGDLDRYFYKLIDEFFNEYDRHHR